jgi:GMP synthase-like glutamine amidotransferase
MILIIDMNFKKDSLGFPEFVSPIVAVVEELEECFVRHYSELRQEDLSNCSRIILSGTALKDNATLKQTEKFEWIKDYDKPILGVCAGMQTIGLVFGARLERCLEIGMTQIATLNANSLFSSTFKAYALHNYSIQPSTEFDVLADSAKCVQAIKHKQKDIYGVLFHPEVRNKEIIQHFIMLFNQPKTIKRTHVKNLNMRRLGRNGK